MGITPGMSTREKIEEHRKMAQEEYRSEKWKEMHEEAIRELKKKKSNASGGGGGGGEHHEKKAGGDQSELKKKAKKVFSAATATESQASHGISPKEKRIIQKRWKKRGEGGQEKTERGSEESTTTPTGGGGKGGKTNIQEQKESVQEDVQRAKKNISHVRTAYKGAKNVYERELGEYRSFVKKHGEKKGGKWRLPKSELGKAKKELREVKRAGGQVKSRAKQLKEELGKYSLKRRAKLVMPAALATGSKGGYGVTASEAGKIRKRFKEKFGYNPGKALFSGLTSPAGKEKQREIKPITELGSFNEKVREFNKNIRERRKRLKAQGYHKEGGKWIKRTKRKKGKGGKGGGKEIPDFTKREPQVSGGQKEKWKGMNLLEIEREKGRLRAKMGAPIHKTRGMGPEEREAQAKYKALLPIATKKEALKLAEVGVISPAAGWGLGAAVGTASEFVPTAAKVAEAALGAGILGKYGYETYQTFEKGGLQEAAEEVSLDIPSMITGALGYGAGKGWIKENFYEAGEQPLIPERKQIMETMKTETSKETGGAVQDVNLKYKTPSKLGQKAKLLVKQLPFVENPTLKGTSYNTQLVTKPWALTETEKLGGGVTQAEIKVWSPSEGEMFKGKPKLMSAFSKETSPEDIVAEVLARRRGGGIMVRPEQGKFYFTEEAGLKKKGGIKGKPSAFTYRRRAPISIEGRPEVFFSKTFPKEGRPVVTEEMILRTPKGKGGVVSMGVPQKGGEGTILLEKKMGGMGEKIGSVLGTTQKIKTEEVTPSAQDVSAGFEMIFGGGGAQEVTEETEKAGEVIGAAQATETETKQAEKLKTKEKVQEVPPLGPIFKEEVKTKERGRERIRPIISSKILEGVQVKEKIGAATMEDVMENLGVRQEVSQATETPQTEETTTAEAVETETAQMEELGLTTPAISPAAPGVPGVPEIPEISPLGLPGPRKSRLRRVRAKNLEEWYGEIGLPIPEFGPEEETKTKAGGEAKIIKAYKGFGPEEHSIFKFRGGQFMEALHKEAPVGVFKKEKKPSSLRRGVSKIAKKMKKPPVLMGKGPKVAKEMEKPKFGKTFKPTKRKFGGRKILKKKRPGPPKKVMKKFRKGKPGRPALPIGVPGGPGFVSPPGQRKKKEKKKKGEKKGKKKSRAKRFAEVATGG